MICLNMPISLVTRAQAASAPSGRTRKPALIELVFHVRRGEDLERLGLQPFDVGGRRLGRRQQHASVGEDEILVAGFLHGRHVRQIGPAGLARRPRARAACRP